MRVSKLLSVLCALVLCLSFTACGSGQSADENGTTAPAEIIENDGLTADERTVVKKLASVIPALGSDPTTFTVLEIGDFNADAKTFVAKVQGKNQYGDDITKYFKCDFDAANQYVTEAYDSYSYAAGVYSEVDLDKINSALKDKWKETGLGV